MKTNPKAKPLTELGAHARQGDVLLRRIDSIPSGLKRTKGVTLAYGEMTGHSHTFDGGAVGFADDEKGLAEFVEVTKPDAPLVHQEHDTHQYPKGNYENIHQFEYTPAAIVPVAD
jgi:hypothetical protein